MNFKKLIKELCAFDYEQEWFEFKENWFEADELGKYISALANAAAFENRDFAYFIWGVSDDGHKIVGTNFNPDMDYRKEPLKHFLSRQLYPENNFSFFVEQCDDKRVVILQIPLAKKVPLSWKGQRYIRIGSSKELLSKFPEKEASLFRILNSYGNTIESTPSEYQNLSFSQLLIYYVAKGIPLREESFKENLGLLTKDGQYNIMAQLLSDDSHVSIRVATFLGKTKADPMYTVRVSNAARFTQQQEGTPKYAYTLCLSESFLDKLVAYKAAYIGTEAGKAAVTEYYSTGMYPTLDGYCAAYGAPTSLELALNAQNAAGLKAQTTYIPE